MLDAMQSSQGPVEPVMVKSESDLDMAGFARLKTSTATAKRTVCDHCRRRSV